MLLYTNFHKVRWHFVPTSCSGFIQSQLLGAFRQSSENVPLTYLFYWMCKFLTLATGWWSSRSFNEINEHFYLTVVKAVFSINNQSTLSVVSLRLSDALLPWAPPFSFLVFTFEECFQSSAGKPGKVEIVVFLFHFTKVYQYFSRNFDVQNVKLYKSYTYTQTF